MGFKLNLKFENIGVFAASIFYAVTGVICFLVLAITGEYRLIHMGLIGILSLATAYGLLRRRRWALWSVFVLFFTSTAFAMSMLYYTIGDVLIDAIMVMYLILTWIITIYLGARRKKLEF